MTGVQTCALPIYLRAIRGALAMGLGMHDASAPTRRGTRLVLPEASAQEAALVPTAEVYAAPHLRNVVAHFARSAMWEGEATPSGLTRIAATHSRAHPIGQPSLDLQDVRGQAGPKRALVIAASGGHSLLMVGPPGTGKSMLAQRFAGLLPPMSLEEALESAVVFPNARIAMIPNGVEIPPERSTPPTQSPLRLLYLGRLEIGRAHV